MAEIEGLNGDEMEKLLQFQDLTGIEDINECKETLQSHGWDLEVAVQDTLNVREGRPSVFNQETHRHAQIDDQIVSNEVIPRYERFYIPARDPNQSLFSYIIYIVYNVVTQTVWSVWSFFARYLRPGRRRAAANEIALPTPEADTGNATETPQSNDNTTTSSPLRNMEPTSRRRKRRLDTDQNLNENSIPDNPPHSRSSHKSRKLRAPYSCSLSPVWDSESEESPQVPSSHNTVLDQSNLTSDPSISNTDLSQHELTNDSSVSSQMEVSNTSQTDSSSNNPNDFSDSNNITSDDSEMNDYSDPSNLTNEDTNITSDASLSGSNISDYFDLTNDDDEDMPPSQSLLPIRWYQSADLPWRPPTEQGSATGGVRSEPVEDVEKFIENFNEAYCTDSTEMRPAFWRSSYSQALAAAKQELKFLLIYLHCKDNQHTDAFCRETLCSLLLMEYLRQANWLLWGCDVRSCEGYRVSQALRENSYPFLAVAVLRGTRMTVVARFEGPISAEDLVTTLRNVVSENEMSLTAARAERNERSLTQSLRRQQDEAYQESLLADQLKEVRRREQLEAERLEQERVRQEQEEHIRKKEEIARLKIELADRLPEEPESDNPNAVHLVIKLPSGRRLERRFLAHHSMLDVYHYVFCHPESPDEFEIATNFPKRVLAARLVGSSVSEVASLEQAGLRGKQALFVYDLDA